MHSRFKIFSDPVHGFISVPKGLIVSLIQTPEVQRLRRVRQLGVGYLVFPGAEHTRFGHALGAMALMQDTLSNLSEKGTPISPAEAQAAMAAALLHDVGHGPFSHTLEHELITDFRHEDMSRQMILRLNDRFDGALDLTLRLFDDTYERPFFHQLISSQLDMDRLDYLRRDSFYTGVAEGVIGVDRIIKTLRVEPTHGGPDARIVIEAKGTYAVESFLLSRRLMYWQVYLHKTVLSGDHLLQAIFNRARFLLRHDPNRVPATSPSLRFFLEHTVRVEDIEIPAVLDHFCLLDDTDVLFSLKQWKQSPDPILADLSRRFIDRDFFRVTFLDTPPNRERLHHWKAQVAAWMNRSSLVAEAPDDLTPYYLLADHSRHSAYEPETNSISVLDREGHLQELSETPDTSTISAIARSVVKPYVCYPKEVALDL